MKKKHYHRIIPTAGLLLVAASASAQQDQGGTVYLDSTNRLSLSVRFGLNISAKFRGIGGSLNPSLYNGLGQRTPNGNPYNYNNGYVLEDVSHDAGGQTWNWGYNNASQVDAANSTISFNRTTAAPNGTPADNGCNDASTPGFELAYDRQLGTKENWHNLRYGVEAAFNYQPISIKNSSTFGATATQQTDTYGYTPGTTPPGYNQPGLLPYQGSYNGPGFVINVPRTGTSTAAIPGVTVSDNDDFEANLWGFRLGPYVELPFGGQEQFTLSLSAGLAVGLLDANESWNQTVVIPGQGPITSAGGGNDFDVLWGGYAAVNGNYQFGKHWGVTGGVQFQDLSKYNQNFDGRSVSLDLSQSIFLLVGVSYNF